MKKNHFCRAFILCLSLFSALSSCSTPTNCSTKPYLPRPQGAHSERQLLGWYEHRDKASMDTNYGVINGSYSYQRSFRSHEIADALFGCFFTQGSVLCNGSCSDRVIKVQGSAIAQRDPKAWLADYFGLARQFDGQMTFKPLIQSHIVDFTMQYHFDSLKPGLWIRADLPLILTRWDLSFKETINTTKMVTDHPAGYLHKERLAVSSQTSSMTDFFSGTKTFGDMKEPLNSNLISSHSMHKSAIGDITITVGYNPIVKEEYHIGLGIRTTIPTGSSLHSRYLFEPVVGNGNHWTAGLQCNGSYTLWNNHDETKELILYADAYAEHLFAKTHCVCFDLCGKPMSRYMLIQELGTPNPVQELEVPDNIRTNLQYTGNLYHLANRSTLPARIHYPIQAEGLLTLSYKSNGLRINCGYNLWGRSGARCSLAECDQDTFTKSKFALKGDAQLYGFVLNGTVDVPTSPIALNATQNKATITGGNGSGNFHSIETLRNNNADDPISSFSIITAKASAADSEQIVMSLKEGPTSDVGAQAVGLSAACNTVAAEQSTVRSSAHPRTLNGQDLDTSDGARSLSHTFVAQLGYCWLNKHNTIPFIGIGASIELASSSKTVKTTSSQWGIWLNGGLSFN